MTQGQEDKIQAPADENLQGAIAAAAAIDPHVIEPQAAAKPVQENATLEVC